MSSAKRRSNRGCPISYIQSIVWNIIFNCSTEHHNRGLNAHPCRTPALMQNWRFRSVCPLICPVWFDHTICNNKKRSWHPMQSQTAPQNIPVHNALEKSSLRIHNGVLANNVLSITILALSKYSPNIHFVLTPCCSSGWACSNSSSVRPKTKSASVLCMSISNGPEVRGGFCVLCFWKHLAQWVCQDDGISAFQDRSGQVRSGQLARPDGSPMLGRKQLYTKRNTYVWGRKFQCCV